MAKEPTSLDRVIQSLRDFEDVVRSGDFESAQLHLEHLTGVLDAHWNQLQPSERAIVDQSVLAGLNWARTFVTASREQTRAHLERVTGARVYQMSAPRDGAGASLSLVG